MFSIGCSLKFTNVLMSQMKLKSSSFFKTKLSVGCTTPPSNTTEVVDQIHETYFVGVIPSLPCHSA